MNTGTTLQTEIAGAGSLVNKRSLLLRLLRASQPISRTEIAERLRIDKSTVTENVKPLINSGIIREVKPESKAPGRRARMLSFSEAGRYFIGVNLGVRRTQVGISTLVGELTEEIDFETPAEPTKALRLVNTWIDDLKKKLPGGTIERIGVSVP